MAKIEVTYAVVYTETIDWPDDEMDNFNYDNLVANCDPSDDCKARVSDHNYEIKDVQVNGKDHDF